MTRNLYTEAIAKYGAGPQWEMVKEECLELALEVQRMGRGRTTPEKLAEEIADVEIMLAQARLMVGSEPVDAAKVRKLARLQQRIEGE